MEELKQDLKEHMAEDKIAFQQINSKLDQLLGQWKLVGAIVGVLTGIVAGYFF